MPVSKPSSDNQSIPARHLRRGDIIDVDGKRKIVRLDPVSRKSDRTVRISYVAGRDEDFDARKAQIRVPLDHAVTVYRRDTLPTAFGPRRSAYGG